MVSSDWETPFGRHLLVFTSPRGWPTFYLMTTACRRGSERGLNTGSDAARGRERPSRMLRDGREDTRNRGASPALRNPLPPSCSLVFFFSLRGLLLLSSCSSLSSLVYHVLSVGTVLGISGHICTSFFCMAFFLGEPRSRPGDSPLGKEGNGKSATVFHGSEVNNRPNFAQDKTLHPAALPDHLNMFLFMFLANSCYLSRWFSDL